MSTAEEKRWFAAVAALENCVLCGQHGVQVSHSNLERGLGQKSKPWYTAALCPACHIEVDADITLSRDERRALHCLAVMRTHGRLIEKGMLKLCAP